MRDTFLIRIDVMDNKPERASMLVNTVADEFVEKIRNEQARPYADQLSSIQAQMTALDNEMEKTEAEIGELTDQQVQYKSELTRLEDSLAEMYDDIRSLRQELINLNLKAADLAEIITISEPAAIPRRPAQNQMLYMVIASLAGGLAALGAAFILESLNDSIQSGEEVENSHGLPTLARIGILPQKGDEVVFKNAIPTALSEEFRTLAASIMHINPELAHRSLMITSAVPNEGKTFVTANLGAALAQAGLKVGIIDADTRLSRLHKVFEIESGEGYAEALQDKKTATRLRATGIENLEILTSGNIEEDRSKLVHPANMKHILENLLKRLDLILIDSPPVLPVADAAILASFVDGVLVVVKSNRTRRREVSETVRRLHKSGAQIIGFILNGDKTVAHHYYHKYYRGYTNRIKTPGHDGRSNYAKLSTLKDNPVQDTKE
jgi:non-specific protein-tyrosine kinase